MWNNGRRRWDNRYYYFQKGGKWAGDQRRGLLRNPDGTYRDDGGCGIKQDGTLYTNGYGDVTKNVCCGAQGCPLNLSYIISAPLHYQGFYEFWKAADYCVGRPIAFIDALLHVLLWVVVFIVDVWILSTGDMHHQWLRELQIGAVVCICLALFGLLVAQVFGWLGQPAGKAWPTTVGLIMGGGMASLVFSIMLALSFSYAWPALLDATNPDASPPAVSIRQLTITAIPLKIFALATTRANLDFWGSCEQADKLNNICALMADREKLYPRDDERGVSVQPLVLEGTRVVDPDAKGQGA